MAALLLGMSSCKKQKSATTGWNYNDAKNGGFEVAPFEEQATGPGLVFIEGGSFVMGQMEEDVMKDWNNTPRRVSVASFYMDECEISNVDYLEYLYWLERVFIPQDLKVVYDNAVPDDTISATRLSVTIPWWVSTGCRPPTTQLGVPTVSMSRFWWIAAISSSPRPLPQKAISTPTLT